MLTIKLDTQEKITLAGLLTNKILDANPLTPRVIGSDDFQAVMKMHNRILQQQAIIKVNPQQSKAFIIELINNFNVLHIKQTSLTNKSPISSYNDLTDSVTFSNITDKKVQHIAESGTKSVVAVLSRATRVSVKADSQPAFQISPKI